MSRVSLIILNRNGRHFLGPCLESIKKQIRAPDEIMVADNGSEDGSQDFLRQHYPEVSILEMGRNAGFSVAMNRAVEAASGDYVALLNNDTECDPGWLDALMSALDRHPDVGFCASKMLYYDQRDIIDTAGDTFSRGGFAFKRGWLHLNRDAYTQPERVFGACAGAVIYRKHVFEEIGGFDEDFFAYQEDTDLNFRAQLAGYPCLFVPGAIVYHHVGGTWRRSGHEFSIQLGQQNLIYVLVKNLPGALWLRYGIRIVLAHACLFLMRVRGGYGTAVLKGCREAVKGLRPMLQKRRRIQAERQVSSAYLASIMDPHWIRTLFDPFRRKRLLKQQGIILNQTYKDEQNDGNTG